MTIKNTSAVFLLVLLATGSGLASSAQEKAATFLRMWQPVQQSIPVRSCSARRTASREERNWMEFR
jgi:hypothetical protein